RNTMINIKDSTKENATGQNRMKKTSRLSNLRGKVKGGIRLILPLLIILVIPVIAAADPQNLNIKLDGGGTTSLPIQIIGLLSLLTFIPALLISVTCFTRL